MIKNKRLTYEKNELEYCLHHYNFVCLTVEFLQNKNFAYELNQTCFRPGLVSLQFKILMVVIFAGKNIIPDSCFIYFPYKISIIKPKKSFTVGTCIYTKFVCIYTSTLPQRFYLKQIIVTKYVYFLIVNLLQNRLQRIMTMRFGLPSYPSRACVLFTMESGRFFRGRRWVLCVLGMYGVVQGRRGFHRVKIHQAL